MAKSLILGLLSEHLGKYVEGIDKRDNLKFGVLSGHIEFHYLTLKKDALEFQNSLDLQENSAQSKILHDRRFECGRCVGCAHG